MDCILDIDYRSPAIHVVVLALDGEASARRSCFGAMARWCDHRAGLSGQAIFYRLVGAF
jgi:hypothetical protein